MWSIAAKRTEDAQRRGRAGTRWREAPRGVGRVWLLQHAPILNADKPQRFWQTADPRASRACACAKPACYSPKAKMFISDKYKQDSGCISQGRRRLHGCHVPVTEAARCQVGLQHWVPMRHNKVNNKAVMHCVQILNTLYTYFTVLSF